MFVFICAVYVTCHGHFSLEATVSALIEPCTSCSRTCVLLSFCAGYEQINWLIDWLWPPCVADADMRTLVIGVSQTLRRWTTYTRQGIALGIGPHSSICRYYSRSTKQKFTKWARFNLSFDNFLFSSYCSQCIEQHTDGRWSRLQCVLMQHASFV